MRQHNLDTIFPYERDIPAMLLKDIPVIQNEYLVNGRLEHWEGPFREVFSAVYIRTPSNMALKMIGTYPLMTEKESLEALDSARKAYDNGKGPWPAMTSGERIAHFETFISGMMDRREQVIHLLMWEIGKSYLNAQGEFDRTIAYMRETIYAYREMEQGSPQGVMGQGILGVAGRAPIGIVLCVGPFNYPLFETLSVLAPALLTGNTVIFKPPRYGTLLFKPLLAIFRDAFPPGAVNTVYGQGKALLPPLLSSGGIDALAFIGTSSVAAYLKGLHPKPHRLRCVLGLEAKNPAIILPDADIDATVEECVKGALAFNGQRCAALKIFFVHTSLVPQFLERFSEKIMGLKYGMPWEEDVFLTPLAEPGKSRYLDGLVRDACDLGARVVNDGGGLSHETFFYPALLYPVTEAMRVYHEEQFGPVIPVVPYDDLNEAIRYTTESNYGQQASIFGRNRDMVAQLVDVLIHQVSRVNINIQCQRSPDTVPFTGRKDSAEGSLSASDALQVFTTPYLIATKETDENRGILEAVGGKELAP
ncbi:MAG: NADP-dependent glyceraldehyde-3-phosphate dehydrogenase [Syntrophus sp. (in: bacteria)]|nr:NADP-dependent glyceraldehyde-3-phosphate dehydrogenase [Syntrophus sp. (in: bacteria)]